MESVKDLRGTRLLLMGSKGFKAERLPPEVTPKIDEAIARNMTIIVGEAPEACRLFQDWLQSKSYQKVIVGHAKSMRYNIGNWRTIQYGTSLMEREYRMIEDCDSAIAIWKDETGVVAGNLEQLKNLANRLFSTNSQQKVAQLRLAGSILVRHTILTSG